MKIVIIFLGINGLNLYAAVVIVAEVKSRTLYHVFQAQKSLHPCALDENSLSIGRVKSLCSCGHCG